MSAPYRDSDAPLAKRDAAPLVVVDQSPSPRMRVLPSPPSTTKLRLWSSERRLGELVAILIFCCR